MKYLLDFDRTVFDMDGLYLAIATQNPDATLGTTGSLVGIDIEALLFPDALGFFATHDQNQIEIISSGFGLTAQWEVAYQTEKIKLSGIAKYVTAIHVVPDSKVSTIKRLVRESEGDVTYVDDHPENIKNALQNIPTLSVVYLDRSGEQKEIPGATTIARLTDISTII
jgi:hypothetical protein